MKIVDVSEFYAERGGGVKTYSDEKLREATALGHELVVIAPGPRDAREARFGGHVVWVKGPPMPLDPRYFVMHRIGAVHEIIDREHPDVIEGSSTWAAGWIAARYRGAGAKALIYHQDPVAVYPQTLFDRWFSPDSIDAACFPYWEYVRRLAVHFDATVVAGEWLRDRLSKFGVPRPETVPFGIDRGLFARRQPDASLRRELLSRCGLPDAARLLVSVSRHHPEKRLGLLFRALARARQRMNIGLVVFGDGPLRPVVEAHAARVGGVYVAGQKERAYVARALGSADAMLHGSSAETYGFVIAEAMCCGTPIVVPDRGGAFELVTPEFSEAYRAGDVEDCAGATLRLLERDRAAMSEAALDAAARSVLEPRQHFAHLFELYGELVARQAR